MDARLTLKATIAALVIPGNVILLIPCVVFLQPVVIDRFYISVTAVIAAIAGLAGVAMLVHCIWGFAFHGKGTLAPIDPPKVLVVRGPYRYTRNPMYLSVVVVLLSEAAFFHSLSLLVYTGVVLFGFHMFVILYEEPFLRSQFGNFYEECHDAVPRWWISRRAFNSAS